MKIAVEGCAHGELEKIYNTIENIEKAENIKIDLLLCCGDFQSTRNLSDLQTMAVPKKFQDIGTFYKYYSGELRAPMLTIFIGGNHEASNYLQELPYGGWVAPNIYYLGYAGCIRIGNLRIAGISGIYKGHDYLKGRYEMPPYTDSSIRSVYHVRQLDIFRLKHLTGDIDIFLSHDWPRGIYNYGNREQLARFKPFFRVEMESNQLGCGPFEDLLHIIKPKMWFAAHLHCQFTALVPHNEEITKESGGDEGDENAAAALEAQKKPEPERYTKFLALDKCLPKRRFLQIIDVDSTATTTPTTSNATDAADEHNDAPLHIEYDLEWLAILFNTNNLMSVKNSNYYMPDSRGNASIGDGGAAAGDGGGDDVIFTPTDEQLETVRKKFDNDLRVPNDFQCTVTPYDPKMDNIGGSSPYVIAQPKPQLNNHTKEFCQKLGVDDPLQLAAMYQNITLNSSTNSFNESGGSSLTSELNFSSFRFDATNSSLESSAISNFNDSSIL